MDSPTPGEIRRLRILLVSPFFPYPPTSGFAVRTYNLLRALSARHDVTLLSWATPGDAHGVTELSARFQVQTVAHTHKLGFAKRASQLKALTSPRPFAAEMVRSPEMQRAIDRLCREVEFDLVQIESCTMGQFSYPTGLPIVLDEHNIESELRRRLSEGEHSWVRRAYNTLEYLRFRRLERRVWRKSAACAVTSAREVSEIARDAPRTLTGVAPNGVDLEQFHGDGPPEEPDTVIFNGTFGYRPNADGAEFLVGEVWPRVLARRPDARLRLVGRMPEAAARALARPSVEIVGEVEELGPHLARAAVIAVPIRMGGGTRLKVVEGLSMAKAMVSTSIGCEGVEVEDGRHLLIADDAESFAERVVELLEDTERRAQLGRAGRALMAERYSWEISRAQLETLYAQVLGFMGPDVRQPSPSAPTTEG